MSKLSERVLDEIRELPDKFPQPRSAVMPALDLAQEELGYLTEDAMTEVATALKLDAGYVQGVATFYTLFHTEPVGKHRMYICTNISCKLRGADELLEGAMRQVGVTEQGQVSGDGLFSVQAVECLGACEYAPVMRLDHSYHHDLTAEKIDQLIAERKGLLPARGAQGQTKRAERADLTAPGAQVPAKPAEGAPVKRPRAPRRKKADA